MDKIIKNQFIQGDLSKVIWRSSLPMVTAILALLAYDLLESSLIALSGAQSLASLGFTLPLTTGMTAIAIGISIRSNNLVVKNACLQPDILAKSIVRLLISASIATLVFSLLALVINEPLLTLLGNENLLVGKEDHRIIEQQNAYMSIRYLAWICLVLLWQINAILRGLGHIRLASGIMLSWLALKALLAIALLVPESQWYQNGLMGIAYVHAISDTLCALVSFALLGQKLFPQKSEVHFSDLAIQKPHFDTVIIMLQQLVTPLSMSILTMIAAKMGYSYVAAFALLFRLEALFLLFPMVLTTSLPAIIGTNFWSGHFERAKQAYQLVFGFVVASQLGIAVLLLLYSDFIAALICPQEEIVWHLKAYLSWVPWGYLGAGCAIVYQSCLNAEGKPAQASMVGIMHRLVFLLPLTFIGAMLANEQSFYQGIMLGHLSAGLYVFYLFYKKHIQNKELLNLQLDCNKLTIHEKGK